MTAYRHLSVQNEH